MAAYVRHESCLAPILCTDQLVIRSPYYFGNRLSRYQRVSVLLSVGAKTRASTTTAGESNGVTLRPKRIPVLFSFIRVARTLVSVMEAILSFFASLQAHRYSSFPSQFIAEMRYLRLSVVRLQIPRIGGFSSSLF